MAYGKCIECTRNSDNYCVIYNRPPSNPHRSYTCAYYIKKQTYLQNERGQNMTTEQLQERLVQCNKDIAAIEAEKTKLKGQIEEKTQPKFGDIVKLNYDGSKRVWLYDSKGRLQAFNIRGRCVGDDVEEYTSIGRNIFDMLGLDI